MIAAITVPSLIAKYQDQQLTTQFRKAYSSLSNAINKTNLIDFNGQAECFYGENGLSNNSSGCASFFNTLSKNLKQTKTCNANAKTQGCVPQYSSYATNAGCSGFSENYINNINTVYVLSDGQIIITYFGNSYSMPLFLIDINGFRGPNKYGYDLFSFHIYKNKMKGLYLKPQDCSPATIATGGRSSNAMMQHAFSGKK